MAEERSQQTMAGRKWREMNAKKRTSCQGSRRTWWAIINEPDEGRMHEMAVHAGDKTHTGGFCGINSVGEDQKMYKCLHIHVYLSLSEDCPPQLQNLSAWEV